MIERKEQQTKPDCSDVAVQSTPDCKEVAVQVHTAAKTTGTSNTFILNASAWPLQQLFVMCPIMAYVGNKMQIILLRSDLGLNSQCSAH